MDTTVSLDDEQARSIAAGAAAGRCASSSDVVLAALRLLERAETEDVGKLRFLREAWQEGIDSGDAAPGCSWSSAGWRSTARPTTTCRWSASSMAPVI